MHHPLKWGIDLDGCVANFNEGFAERLRAKGVEVPSFEVAWPTTWHWPQQYASPEVVNATWAEVWNDPLFWWNLAPLKEVFDTDLWHRLRELEAEGHELYFMTHRQGVRVHAQSVKWLRDYLGLRSPQVLIVPGSKARVAKQLNLDVALDDMPMVAEEYSRLEDRRPAFRSFMLARPYNSHVTYVNRADTVAQVVQVVMGTATQGAMVVS